MEMKEQEQVKVKRNKELEQLAKEIREIYGKTGILSDKVFDVLNNY